MIGVGVCFPYQFMHVVRLLVRHDCCPTMKRVKAYLLGVRGVGG